MWWRRERGAYGRLSWHNTCATGVMAAAPGRHVFPVASTCGGSCGGWGSTPSTWFCTRIHYLFPCRQLAQGLMTAGCCLAVVDTLVATRQGELQDELRHQAAARGTLPGWVGFSCQV
jgi:hypothetical protein